MSSSSSSSSQSVMVLVLLFSFTTIITMLMALVMQSDARTVQELAMERRPHEPRKSPTTTTTTTTIGSHMMTRVTNNNNNNSTSISSSSSTADADADADSDIKLYGDWLRYGEYYVKISIGSQNFTVQVDTGSSDLAVPMKSCSNCGPLRHPPYDPSLSIHSSPVSCLSDTVDCHCTSCSCLTNNQCQYSLNYADQTGFTAEVFNDTVSIGPYSARMAVGAITSEHYHTSGFQPPTTDGIIGFAYQSASKIRANTFFDHLVESDQVDNIFSMCLTKNGGALTLGGIGQYYFGNINYTPIYGTQQFYQVYMYDMRLGGTSIGVSPSVWNGGAGTIVDSGTTDIVMPKSAYLDLKTAFLALCDSNKLKGICSTDSAHTLFDGYCYEMSSSEVAAFPTIDIILGEEQNARILLSIPPKQYLVAGRCQYSSYLTLAIDSLEGLDVTLLGDAFMQGYEVVFDRAHSRIGFGNVFNCPSYYDQFLDPLGIVVFIVTLVVLCCCCCCPLICLVCFIALCMSCISSTSSNKHNGYGEIRSNLGSYQSAQQYSHQFPQQYQQYPQYPHPQQYQQYQQQQQQQQYPPAQYGAYASSGQPSMYGQLYPQPAPQQPYLPITTYAYPSAPQHSDTAINAAPAQQNSNSRPAWMSSSSNSQV